MGSVLFFNKMGVGSFHNKEMERKKSARNHGQYHHDRPPLKVKYVQKKRSNEIFEIEEPESEIETMSIDRTPRRNMTLQDCHHNMLTRRRAVTFACIGVVAAGMIIGMSFIPYQYTHINISSETKREKGICDGITKYEATQMVEENEIHQSEDLLEMESTSETIFETNNNTIDASNDNSSLTQNHNESHTMVGKDGCHMWSIKDVLSSEIWFGAIFGISSFATLLAGFQPSAHHLVCCLIFSIISVITSLILLFYSVIWHSISMVISIVQGIMSFICLIMASKDVCHMSRPRNEVV